MTIGLIRTKTLMWLRRLPYVTFPVSTSLNEKDWPQIFMALIFILNVGTEAYNIECGGDVHFTYKLNLVCIIIYLLHNLVGAITSSHKFDLPS